MTSKHQLEHLEPPFPELSHRTRRSLILQVQKAKSRCVLLLMAFLVFSHVERSVPRALITSLLLALMVGFFIWGVHARVRLLEVPRALRLGPAQAVTDSGIITGLRKASAVTLLGLTVLLWLTAPAMVLVGLTAVSFVGAFAWSAPYYRRALVENRSWQILFYGLSPVLWPLFVCGLFLGTSVGHLYGKAILRLFV